MKKKINCFIPFGNPKDTIQTVKELQASELVNKIYLLSADTNKECLPGCECLLINGLYSTSTIKTIADNADDASYLLLYTKQTPLKLGLYALERMTQIIQSSSENAMVYADHYQLVDGVLKQAPVIDYQQGSLRVILISVRCFYSIPKFSPLLQVFWRKQFSNMLHFMKCV